MSERISSPLRIVSTSQQLHPTAAVTSKHLASRYLQLRQSEQEKGSKKGSLSRESLGRTYLALKHKESPLLDSTAHTGVWCEEKDERNYERGTMLRA